MGSADEQGRPPTTGKTATVTTVRTATPTIGKTPTPYDKDVAADKQQKQPEPKIQLPTPASGVIHTAVPLAERRVAPPVNVAHPHSKGVQQAGVPLPSDAVAGAVYVNEKQYYGILRRRKSRAKAESEYITIKCRKIEESTEELYDKDSEPAKWLTDVTDLYLDIIIEQINLGNGTTSNFSKKTWSEILKIFNGKTKQNYTLLQLKNKVQRLRKDHKDLKKLLGETGFSWDPETRTVTAENEAWATYIKENPSVVRFKKNGCPCWERLQLVFEAANAQDPQDSGENAKVTDLQAEHDNTALTAITEDDDGETRSQKKKRTRGKGKKTLGLNVAGKAIAKKARLASYNTASSCTSPSPNAEADPYSITKCMEILNNMEEIGQEEYLKATKLLQDSGWRETFVNVPAEKKIWWLKRCL